MRRNVQPSEPEDADSPLVTGFWIGFWSLLTLIVGSWFIKVPLIGLKTGSSSGRVSFFKEDTEQPPVRGIAGGRPGSTQRTLSR